MALMLGSLYEALKEAGSTEEKARHAAEEVVKYEERMHSIERRLVRVEALQAATFAGVLALVVKAYLAWHSHSLKRQAAANLDPGAKT